MSFSHVATGSLNFSGEALTPCYAYVGSGSLGLTGSADQHFESDCYEYVAYGSLSESGLATEALTVVYVPTGRVRLKGYGIFAFSANPVTPETTSLILGGHQPLNTRKAKLVLAYSMDTAASRKWDKAHRAFIPVGTASTYQVINRREVPPGTNPHYGIIISED